MGTYSGVSEVLARMKDIVEFHGSPPLDVHHRGLFGNTPLKVAAVWGDLDAALLLIEAGADVNAKNEDGYTALHWAAENDDHALAAALVERGASLIQRNTEGQTPGELAKLWGHAAMAAALGHTPP